MLEFLRYVDTQIFYFLNTTLANPLLDMAMPFLTDLNKHFVGWFCFLTLWLLLMVKGGKQGRILGVLIIFLIVVSDQLSSSLLKQLFQRSRPCWVEDRIVTHVRILVSCGGGFSFPSSHAVNNFAIAAFISHYYRALTIPLYAFAAIVGFSRVYVGVHFPFDVLAGALVGVGCAYALIAGWTRVARRYPAVALRQVA